MFNKIRAHFFGIVRKPSMSKEGSMEEVLLFFRPKVQETLNFE
jgi:hypothetical protein